MTRDEMQEAALDSWINSDFIGTLLMGTGTGKSFTAIKALKYLLDTNLIPNCKKVLLAVSDTNLRDNSWEVEFNKMKMARSYYEIEVACYQSTANFVGRDFDLIIADEFDFALTPAYSRLFTENTFQYILGLTAFIDKSKKEMSDAIAPVRFDFSTGRAQSVGMLNKSVLVGVSFELSTKKDITITYTKGEFKTSENDQYVFLNNRVDKNTKAYHAAKAKIRSTPSTSQRAELADLKKLLDISMRNRAKFLYNCNTGIKVAKMIADHILQSNTNNKLLVFSERKEASAKICEKVYNGDVSKELKKLTLNQLDAGVIRQLGLCKALDRGANIHGINSMLFHTFTSSPTSFAQRHGRGCRLPVDQLMYFYILVPYYKKKVKVEGSGVTAFATLPTQQRGWASSMLDSFVPSKTERVNLGEIQ